MWGILPSNNTVVVRFFYQPTAQSTAVIVTSTERMFRSIKFNLVLLSVVLHSSVQPGAAQCDGKSIVFAIEHNITVRIVARITGAVYEALRPFMNEMRASLEAVKSDLEEYKNQTTTELANLQSSINNPPLKEMSRAVLQILLPYLNDIEEDLSNHVSSKLAVLQNKQDVIDSKLDLLDSKQDELDMKVMSVNTKLEQNILSNVTNQLQETSDSLLHASLGHICGGTGGWRRVVYLDMTDPNTNCPSGWQLTRDSKRTCGRVNRRYSLTCDSVIFPVSGGAYTSVCGTIRAYQNGPTDAFEAYHIGRVTTIDGPYVSGVSLTHGSPRQHIWTFAAGIYESESTSRDACPCDATIDIDVPSFVGGDYFCESGVSSGSANGFHPDDPLWDGEGCISSSTCCSFNNPPYFTKQLPNPTTDDIEARICLLDSDDDSPIEFIELYVL